MEQKHSKHHYSKHHMTTDEKSDKRTSGKRNLEKEIRTAGFTYSWDASCTFISTSGYDLLASARNFYVSGCEPIVAARRNTRRMAIANGTCVSSAHFGLPWVRPWDNHGKCYMDGKRIQCWSKASQHVLIYLQPFTSYSEILVGNCNFFLLPLHLTPPLGCSHWYSGKKFGLKLESWGYQVVKTVWR